MVNSALPEHVQQLRQELANSVQNDALCQLYRQEWSKALQRSILESGHTRLFSALQESENSITNNPALFYEQWGCIGHPFHPGHKSKTGLSEAEVLALSPEFQPQLELVFGAIHASVAKLSGVADAGTYRTWMAAQFPAEMVAWSQAICQRGDDPEAWLPLPIHPYQAQHALPEKFGAVIRDGLLHITDDFPRLHASPTMSFRTVACSSYPLAPHLKLPLALQLTSAQRTVSPKATVMGPRVSHLLKEIIRGEDGFGNTLDILGEEVGLHYIDPNGDVNRAKHLSILFRENPAIRCPAGSSVVPVGALFADSPMDGRPIITEMIALAGAEDYFQDYVLTVLRASLCPYLIYGVAFEAHQQNSLVLFNARGEAEKLILRDFGDIRIHAPTLQERGMHVDAYQEEHVLFDDAEIVREKFIHTTMFCHLAELAVLLARTFEQSEDDYWKVIANCTALMFEECRPRCNPQRWEQERQAILYDDWKIKSLLRMRLHNTIDDICQAMPNPLADFV